MKKKLIFPIFLCFLVLTLLSPSINDKSTITVSAAGSKDGYNNYISHIMVHAWNESDGGMWSDSICAIYFADYVTGTSYQVEPNVPLRFRVSIRLNETLASSGNEALARTRAYLTISGIMNNQIMDDEQITSDETVGGYYIIVYMEYWTSGPAASTSYVISVQYQVKVSA